MSDASQWVTAGNALCRGQRWQEAIEAFRRALVVSPGDAAILSNLSVAHLRCGRAAEATHYAKQAFALDHSNSAICANLGACLVAQGQWSEAIQAFRAALEREPDKVEIWCNLGQAFQAQELLGEATKCFRRAIDLDPSYAEGHCLLGNTFKKAGQLEEAIGCYRRALELAPGFVEAHNNLGTALELEGKLAEAGECYRRALELDSEFIEARWNNGALLLLAGDFEHGWTEYEWRWRKLPSRGYDRPHWNGEDVAGKTVLLHSEQGLGDTIQFIRYAPCVKRLGARVVVECHRALRRLLETCAGIDQRVDYGDSLPEYDFYAPLLSLPRIFQTTLQTIPAEVPYLHSELGLVGEWRERLRAVDGFHVGVNWQGRGGAPQSLRRDIPPETLWRLSEIPGVCLISLQKGEGQSTLAAAGSRVPIIDLGEFDTENGPFMDTAAIMMNLDLVITSDTSIAHLAGALGVPVWVALPFVPDWRWMLDRSDSPWYPTMRLFRQKKLGDWEEVFGEIEAALRERVSGSKFQVSG
jgi:Flp pilus assembly protein TadD